MKDYSKINNFNKWYVLFWITQEKKIVKSIIKYYGEIKL